MFTLASYASDGLISEADQAYLFTRNMLLTIATTGGPTIWYMWKDYPNSPFGTVQQQFHSGQQPPFTPKPAFHALTTLTTQLAGVDFVARVPVYQSGMSTFDDFVRVCAWWRVMSVEAGSVFALLATRVTLACACVGVPVRVDVISSGGRWRQVRASPWWCVVEWCAACG